MVTVANELQLLAEEWATADVELGDAEQAVVVAQREADNVRRRKEEAARKLNDRVGRNIATRVFKVGDSIILIEYERGIRRMRIEDAT